MEESDQRTTEDDSVAIPGVSPQQAPGHAKREILRLNQLLLAQSSRLKEMESSASWRYTRPFRLMPRLRVHLRPLVVLALFSLITLPLWPVFIILMLVPAGRHFIWTQLLRFPDLLDLLMLIKAHLPGGSEPRTESTSQTQVYSRNQSLTDTLADEERRWTLLQLLSPQKRHLVASIRDTQSDSRREGNNPELNSLSASEASLLKVCTDSESGQV